MRHTRLVALNSAPRVGFHYRWLALTALISLLSACVTGTAVGTRVDPRAIALARPADTVLYMDTQEYELKELLADSGIDVERVRDDIILRVHGTAAFAPDQADLNPAFQAALVGLTEILLAYDRTLIDVSGYTDATGPMLGNMALSVRRAEVVAELLQGQGIAAERITARGLGPLHPVGDNTTNAGRQLNRRVELTIRPVPPPVLAASAGD